MPLPEPPAGFALGDNGKVLLTSTNRLVTVVDPTNKLPLECVVRRVFRSSERDECMLLCPVDTPVQILKNTLDGWSAISDEEVESILPAAAYALAKIHMHLVYSDTVILHVVVFATPKKIYLTFIQTMREEWMACQLKV